MEKNDGRALAGLVQYVDETLRIREIDDYANALNGLQIENDGRVSKIGAAVDASVRTFEAAVAERIDLLIVHHGIFWPGLRPVTGATRDLLRLGFTNNLAL